jgi:histidinol phosphatase-like enzyme
MKKKIKIICFDIDNVICKTSGNDYERSKPDKTGIKIINNLYDKGFYIKIFTARYMGRFKENKKKVIKKHKETENFLKTWGLKYSELIMCKPSYDIFVDDKTFGFSSKWKEYFKKLK